VICGRIICEGFMQDGVLVCDLEDCRRPYPATHATGGATSPETLSHANPQPHTALREAGEEYPKGHDVQSAPHTPGPGGRHVLPGRNLTSVVMRKISALIGGSYDIGPVSILIHDDGIIIARRRFETINGISWVFRTIWREWKI